MNSLGGTTIGAQNNSAKKKFHAFLKITTIAVTNRNVARKRKYRR